MLLFCVKGFLEPYRILCDVSFWNCHIIIENEERYPLKKEDIEFEYSHTSIIDFCKNLYNDISSNVDKWVSFVDYHKDNIGEKNRDFSKNLKD